MSVSIERRNAILANQAFTLPEAGAKLSCSVLVVGGSTAAYTATLGALQAGTDVCLAQPQPVFGGQFTTQALPNAEDNRLVKVGSRFKRLAQETFSMSVSQRWFRDRQRQLQTVAGQRLLKGNADSGNTLLTTPLVAARAMNEAIAPYLAEGKLILIPFAVPVAV
ncbi:MAG: FAD-dependent oxidoreductase, partial [Pseudanabaenales cyanobacterium]|nr:FAD-dependent oxidoreductase [Pseudanabaenales cyanobacterium]